MRVLLDACVPKGLSRSLPDQEVRHATEMAWGDLDNGDLLDTMEGVFEALVTVDQGIPAQQNLSGRTVGIVVIQARSNRLTDLLPCVPAVVEALESLQPGQFVVVGRVRPRS
jgi:hypothetical protein